MLSTLPAVASAQAPAPPAPNRAGAPDPDAPASFARALGQAGNAAAQARADSEAPTRPDMPGSIAKPPPETVPPEGEDRGSDKMPGVAGEGIVTLLVDLQAAVISPNPWPAAVPAETIAVDARAESLAARGSGPAEAVGAPGMPKAGVGAALRTPSEAETFDSAAATAAPAPPHVAPSALPVHAFMPAMAPPVAPFLAASAPVAQATVGASPGSAEFGPQIGAQITTFVREGVLHARLHLNPAEMGPVTVQIQLDGQAAQVRLAADHPLTRQALEQAMPLLAGGLRDAGLTLTGGGVFEQPQQTHGQDPKPTPGDGSRGRGERLIALDHSERDTPLTHHVRGVVDLVA